MNSQIDPFSKYRLTKIESSLESPKNLQSSEKSIEKTETPFDQYKIKKAEGFPFISEVGRHATRTASRIGEVIGGIPGDIQSLIQSGVMAGLEKFAGIPITKEVKEKAKQSRFPTSKELKKYSEEYTQGYTSPQGNIEKKIDDYVETAASLLGPMKFRKALGVSLGAQAAKEGLELIGTEQQTQEAGKLGTMFLLSAMNPGGAMRFASSQYEKANALSKGSSIIAKDLEKNLTSLVNKLKEGVTTTEKNAVLRPTEEILKKIKHGKIPVNDLTSAKRDINSIIGEPETLKGSKKLLKNLGNEVDKAIKPYEKINPEFSKAYRPANEIYGAVMQGNKASNFVKKTLGAKSVLGAFLGEAFLGHPEYIIPTAGAAAGTLGAAKTFDFFTRLSKSPELQKYYSKALISAAKEDSFLLRKYEDKIEEFLKND